MHDNEFRIIILLFGFLILIYIFFISKSNRKYKVYKTKNYDVKKTINISINNKSRTEFKNIDISTKKENLGEKKKSIVISEVKPKQLNLSLADEENEEVIVIYSVAKKFYKISDIYNFMDGNNIFLNASGFFEKHHVDNQIRCAKYSVVNISNPGFLEKEKLGDSKIRGLGFFMQLPTKIDPLKVFNEMVNDAKIFTKKYKGTIFDRNKKRLDSNTIKNMKNFLDAYRNEY